MGMYVINIILWIKLINNFKGLFIFLCFKLLLKMLLYDVFFVIMFCFDFI